MAELAKCVCGNTVDMDMNLHKAPGHRCKIRCNCGISGPWIDDDDGISLEVSWNAFCERITVGDVVLRAMPQTSPPRKIVSMEVDCPQLHVDRVQARFNLEPQVSIYKPAADLITGLRKMRDDARQKQSESISDSTYKHYQGLINAVNTIERSSIAITNPGARP